MEKALRIIDKIVRAAASILFGIVSICVLIQIIARYVPAISAPWTDEMTRLFFLYTVMVSAPWAILYHQYASIDIISSRLKGKARIMLDIFVDVVITAITACGIPFAWKYYQVGTFSRSTSLQINLGLFFVVPLVIFCLTVATCLVDIIRNVRKLREGGNEK